MDIRRAIPTDRDVLLDLWLRSVRATHAFVSEEDVRSMIPLVRDYLVSGESELWILCDDTGTIRGFMGMSGSKMESLFLAPEFHRRGGGRRLVRHARALHGELTVDVNEQNVAARRFYEACGFVVEGRSELDEQGRPYPLLHMRLAAPARHERTATVGVAEHGNSAELVTVATGGELLDRRLIDLTVGLPTHPHHHEGSWAVGRYLDSPWARAISLPEAVALVERVREAAARGAREGLEALAAAVPVPIASIAIRACPELPPTPSERIADHRAQTVADSVMYRQALATAGAARGWSVYWYDPERVFRDAAAALGREDVDAYLRAMGRSIGPPWQARHKLAAAAALAATVTGSR